MTVSEVIGRFVGALLKGVLPKGVQAAVKKHRVRFSVFGYRGSGKTTLLKRMLGQVFPDDNSPTIGKDPQKPFTCYSVGHVLRVKNFADHAGEPAYWDLWVEELIENRPLGIIFLIDDDNLEQHMRAFHFVTEILAVDDRKWRYFRGPHAKARHHLRVVMFLANKEDRWGQSETLAHLLKHFRSDLKRLEALGIPLIFHQCSALQGTNVNEALREFFLRMLFGR